MRVRRVSSSLAIGGNKVSAFRASQHDEDIYVMINSYLIALHRRGGTCRTAIALSARKGGKSTGPATKAAN
jgi:hypothetical protein